MHYVWRNPRHNKRYLMFFYKCIFFATAFRTWTKPLNVVISAYEKWESSCKPTAIYKTRQIHRRPNKRLWNYDYQLPQNTCSRSICSFKETYLAIYKLLKVYCLKLEFNYHTYHTTTEKKSELQKVSVFNDAIDESTH